MGLQEKLCVSDVVTSENHHATKEDRSSEDHYGELPVEEVCKEVEATGESQPEHGETGDEGVGVECEQSLEDIEEK